MRAVLFILTLALALGGVSEPSGGVLLTRGGAVRELNGLSGSFIPGVILASNAQAAASCSGRVVIKSGAEVRLTRGDTYAVPDGPMLAGFVPNCSAVYLYFPQTRNFARLSDGGFEMLPIDGGLLDGEVVALTGDLTVWVRRNDELHQLRVRASDGAVESDERTGIHAELALGTPGGSLIYVNGTAVLIRSADASERVIEVPEPPIALVLINETLVQLQCKGLTYALHLTTGTLTVLPEVEND